MPEGLFSQIGAHLYNSYISKIEFMNSLLANLVFAWLYFFSFFYFSFQTMISVSVHQLCFLFIILHEGSQSYPLTLCMQATPKQLFL